MQWVLAWVALLVTIPGSSVSAQDALADHVSIYGSLRFRGGFESGGGFEINDKASRIGLRGELPMGGDFIAFARAEMGLNIVKSPGQLVFSGDPGFASGEDHDAVTTRLGILGVRSRYGSVSWGKQWSAYYDVGEMTDRFPVFGGEAQGTFNLSDGDASGTGRAGSSFQYRASTGPVALAAQLQNRSVSTNDRDFADTYGGSALVTLSSRLTAGVAFNAVRDGVDVPGPNTADVKSGDQAVILGLAYAADRWEIAGVATTFNEHELDDLDRFYDGAGVEVYAHFDATESVRFAGGVNHLRPESAHPGDFRLTYWILGFQYRFESGSVFVDSKLGHTRTSGGNRLRSSVYGFGMRFDF